jgi:hypothetical protein
MTIVSKVLSAAGSRRRPWVLAVVTLFVLGTTEALAVGFYYSMERIRLLSWAQSESRVTDEGLSPETGPCPNRMQPPACQASQAPASESASDTEIVLKLLEVRNAGRFVLGSDRPDPSEGDPEPADMP